MKQQTSSILYVPNLIGYTRILLILFSLNKDWFVFTCFYSLSVLLDFFDGRIARQLNQTSVLGSVLDLVTDRVTTAVLCIRIVSINQQFLFSLSLFVFTDILCHMIYFIAMMHKKVHHKVGGSFILRLYYNDYVLKLLCFGSETGFLAIYLQCCGVEFSRGVEFLIKIFKVLIVIKSIVNIAHLESGIKILSLV